MRPSARRRGNALLADPPIVVPFAILILAGAWSLYRVYGPGDPFRAREGWGGVCAGRMDEASPPGRMLPLAWSRTPSFAVLKRIFRRPGPQMLLGRLIGLYLFFALRTTRWTLVGAEHMAPHANGIPAIVVVWHERLSLMPAQWMMARRCDRTNKRVSRLHILVSRSRHGRLLAGVVRRFGIDAVFGSSSRGGMSGTRSLLRLVAAGDHIGITPDGPRGPRRQASAGAAQLAALSGVPILPCSAQTSRRWTLRSWDRMVIPRPFGRGVIVCGPPILVARRGWRDSTPVIESALTDAADRADRLCRLPQADHLPVL